MIQKFANLLTETQHILPGKFMLIASDIVSLLLLIIFICCFFIFRNRLARFITSVLIVAFSLFLAVQVVLYVYMARIEPNWIKVEKVDLRIPSLGKNLEGVKIAQFSDLHVFKLGLREERFIEIMNSLEPDIILFTGGFTGDDFENIDEGIDGAIKVFSSIKAKMGVWAVTDDTDDGLLGNESFKQGLEEAGVRLLLNDRVRVDLGDGRYFWLIGVEDAFYGHNGLTQAMFVLPLNEPKIIMSHSPDIIEHIIDYKPELILVGKTHGGQIGLEVLRSLSGYVGQFEYIRGLYKVGDTYLYVNRGIGVKTSPYRLLCRPEITVFNITQ